MSKDSEGTVMVDESGGVRVDQVLCQQVLAQPRGQIMMPHCLPLGIAYEFYGS